MKLRSLFVAMFVTVVPVTLLQAAPPFRLFEIYSARIITDTDGRLIIDQGRFNALGEFKHDIYAQAAPGATFPPEMMNRNLLPFSLWPAYAALGPEALDNFKLTSVFAPDGQSNFVVTVADRPKLDIGTLRALSTRGGIAPGGEPLIGGFVIDDHPRRVLIRGIGPTLANFGVATPLANPVLTLFGPAGSLASNDDWGQQANVAEIETASAAAGVYLLNRTSKDAVLLIELPPGAYTAHLGSADATGGTALLEIYMVP